VPLQQITNTTYTWSPTPEVLWRSLTWTPNLLNQAQDYGTGGYLVNLYPLGRGTMYRAGRGYNTTAATAFRGTIEELKSGFISPATRAIAFTAVYVVWLCPCQCNESSFTT